MSDQAVPAWHVRVTSASGAQVLWHKAGKPHVLRFELGQTWVSNFKPAVFQVLPDGSFVPRGSDPRAEDVASVELVETTAPSA